MERAMMRGMLFVWMLAMASVSFAQAAPQAIHGVVVRLEGTQLRVRTNGGTERAIALGDRTRVVVQSAASADSIKPGDFVATTAAPQADGTLRASELRIFSESLRGVGEGHRPMSNLPGSTMTNATVTVVSRPGSSTTNATVATVGARSGERIVKVTYPGGTQTVVVPPGVPVSRIDVGDRTALAPGAHVVVRGAPNANGEFAASRISVGKGGFVPPN